MLAIHMEMGTPSSRIKAIGSIEKYIYVHIHIHIHTNAYAYIIYIYTCILSHVDISFSMDVLGSNILYDVYE